MYVLKGVITTISVDSYDAQTNLIKGSFSGTTVDWNDEVVSIKDGKFSAIVKK
jgi:hypothetical protein